MSNSYFQFQQFRVEQDRTAMKVSTDACIQGAWTPIAEDVSRVLDIGTGTGLLSLMLSQRKPGLLIDAVELEPEAVIQAADNIAGSPWRDHINVIHTDVTAFAQPDRYQMVICNPPFFQNSLESEEPKRKLARHSATLTMQMLFSCLKKNLSDDGYASILLPAAEFTRWNDLVSHKGWEVFHKLLVRPMQTSEPNRVVSLCRPRHGGPRLASLTEELTIYKRQGVYTQAFTELMKGFYLRV